MTYLAIAIALIVALIGAGMTLISLPGTWLVLACAGIFEASMPELLSWRTLVALLVLAISGEIIETFASALGASKAGGSKRAAVGSIVGTIAGAIIATVALPFLPIIATILGAVVGAGIGAIAMQLTKIDAEHSRREHYGHARKVGIGAAKARLVSTIIKSLIALVMGVVLIAAVVIE